MNEYSTLFRFLTITTFLLFSVLSFSQKQITGTVIDAQSNEGLPGATVIIEGSTVGTSTGLDGTYVITAKNTDRLTFSFVGFAPTTVSVGDQSTIDVSLGSDKILDEVIVIGYSTQKKSDKTGAVVNVGADEFNKGRLSDPIQAMQGKAAGVNVSKSGGDPNNGFSVNIRGAAGLTSGTGPLYVVDGVPGVDPTTLNPDDIESINILKDASSAAIYGSRGSNGVVIITTKGSNFGSGQATTRVEYSAFFSSDRVLNKLDMLNKEELNAFAARTGGSFIDNGGDVDWQDAIYREGQTMNNTLAFSGSDENSSYRASLSSNNIRGVMKGSSKERYIGRLNLTQKSFNDRLTLQARFSGTIENNDYAKYGDGTAPNNAIYQALRRSPSDPIYDMDGNYFETDRSFQYFNPLAILEEIEDDREAKRLLGNFRVGLELIDGLTASVNLAYIRDDNENFYFEPSFTASNATEGLGRRSYENNSTQLIETTLNYTKTLKETHNLNVIAGHSYQKENRDGFSAEGKGAQSDFATSNNLEGLLLLEPGSIKSNKSQDLLASFFGRVVYDFDKRYYLTGTIRRDGSSKFGANNEWGWFPSASVGWNILNESFMPEESFLSQLKLRAGYGITGNQEIDGGLDAVYFGPQGTAINPETGETVIAFGNVGDVNPNPDLKWEENKELNIGLDFGLFNDRVSASIEYYNKTTSDLIYRYELPVPPNKNRYIYANAGEIENKGFEVTLLGFPVDRKNFDWKTVLTYSKNKQTTVSLSSDLYDLDMIRSLYVSGRGLVGGENWTQIIAPGYEIGTFYMPEYAGLSDDGEFLFYTASGGVTRDVTMAERRAVGSAQPNYIAGWSNYFSIGKSTEVSFSLRAIVGHEILNVTRMVFGNPADLPTLNTLESAVTDYDAGLRDNPTISSFYLEDADFLRLDNLTISQGIGVNSKTIKNLNLYVTFTNFLTVTNYTGTDPEITYGGFEFGRDQYDVYPKTSSISLGLNAAF